MEGSGQRFIAVHSCVEEQLARRLEVVLLLHGLEEAIGRSKIGNYNSCELDQRPGRQGHVPMGLTKKGKRRVGGLTAGGSRDTGACNDDDLTAGAESFDEEVDLRLLAGIGLL